MITFCKSIAFFTSVCLFFYSCDNDESPDFELDCSIMALYRGTFVCHNGENAAAVEFTSDGSYMIFSNFFELVDSTNIEYDDTIYVEFENVDSTLASSGALCGAAIVAPIALLTCSSY